MAVADLGDDDPAQKDNVVLDGSYDETKEQLLGFYVFDVENLEEGLQFRRELTVANHGCLAPPDPDPQQGK